MGKKGLGHVNNEMSDLVETNLLAEIEVPLPNTGNVPIAGVSPAGTVSQLPLTTAADKKGLLQKSQTCCEFYCDSCSPTTEENPTEKEKNTRPILIQRSSERIHQKKKLFPSFSHPDTDFIFTEDELYSITSDSRGGGGAGTPENGTRRNTRRRDRNSDFELTWPFGSPSQELFGTYRKKISLVRHPLAEEDREKLLEGDSRRDSKSSVGGGGDCREKFTIIPVHPEISIKVRNDPELGCVNQQQQQLRRQSVTSGRRPSGASAEIKIATNNKVRRNSCAINNNSEGRDYNNTEPVKGPIESEDALVNNPTNTPSTVAMGNALFRKSSKVHIIDNGANHLETFQKTSRTPHHSQSPPKAQIGYANSNSSSASRIYGAAGQFAGDSANQLSTEELSNLRDLLKLRDNEIVRLKREIHKLKSVLQQTTEAPLETDLISRLQTPVNTNNGGHNRHEPNASHGNNELASGESSPASAPPPLHLNPLLATKKQGVSAESSENKQQMLKDFTIERHEKDFRSKQLIKDAILDNDFLKHLTSGQIKELVESMWRKEIAQGEYVIREGESGAHLYISDEGEFEVIKDGIILGKMGAGKAFGELAILYNCKRTASIRVLTDAKVWALDRRVFQQIMMRTGLQRIEENVAFLRSIPLLKGLCEDSLAKIADVLEVEFYPTGTYIIRQDTSGDSFFLISQGSVAVTQRLPGTKIEKEIRTLERGDYFGEQALIREDKRTANIVAMCPGVECLTLDREAFRKFIGDLDELHGIDYRDQERVNSFKERERETLSFASATQKQQKLHIELNELEIVATLGVGGFGRVELVKYCGNGRGVEGNENENGKGNGLTGSGREIETFALKCLKKQHILDTHQMEHVFNERSIMMSCESPFICRLYRTYKDSKYIYMMMEACLGGEIWTILRNRGYFDEFSGQFIIGCVLEAFQYLHSRGIVFRDLKPENLLLDANGYVKLIDFGFAKYIGFSSKTWTFCGTPEYVAPEVILNKGHDRAVDYWALGILVYELLTGTPPFTSADPMKTYNIILKNMMEFPAHVSRTAANLVRSLCKDVHSERLGYNQRNGIQEIKKHKWFQGFDWDELVAQTMPSPILNPVESAIDTSNFDYFPEEVDIPPDDFSGWDAEF